MKKKNVIESITAEGVGTETQESDITMKKVYTFRKLESTDMFLMFSILGNIGINEITKSFDAETVKNLYKTKDYTTLGISVTLNAANVIFANLHKCEHEIFQMLSNTSNLTIEQVKSLDFVTFSEMVIDFIKKEEFKDFIKVVLKLFKPGK